jgi:cholesterol transport system auxiliary component
MKNNILAILTLIAALVVPGCATRTESAALYDFGMLRSPPAAALPALAPISIADIGAPTWLDSSAMFFRLSYANDQQARSYAHSRWTMPPTQLFAQRLKSRIAQAGGAALPASDGAANVPVLRIEADDFMQTFDTPAQSIAQVGMRAAVFNGRTLVAQRTFIKQAPAPSPDAAGGARALATASDAVITDMMMWLASLPSIQQAAK